MQKLASGDCETPGDLAAHWAFAYDGDGVRTGQLYTPYVEGSPGTPVLTAYYFGGLYEIHNDGTIRKYYSLAGQTVALSTWDVTLETWNLTYFLTDHLGSTLAVLDDTGAVLEQQRYLPFGAPRELGGYSTIGLTDYTYTFQRALGDELGLMDYKARFYSSKLSRFVQPDTIVPYLPNPQSFNRYSYVYNDPLSLIDPSGHFGKCRDNMTGYQCKIRQRKVAELRKQWEVEEAPTEAAENRESCDTLNCITGGMGFTGDGFIFGRSGSSISAFGSGGYYGPSGINLPFGFEIPFGLPLSTSEPCPGYVYRVCGSIETYFTPGDPQATLTHEGLEVEMNRHGRFDVSWDGGATVWTPSLTASRGNITANTRLGYQGFPFRNSRWTLESGYSEATLYGTSTIEGTLTVEYRPREHLNVATLYVGFGAVAVGVAIYGPVVVSGIAGWGASPEGQRVICTITKSC